MIQFNLLPDVKLAYIKVQRTKRMVISTAIIATASMFAIFLLLFLSVHVVQAKHISDLNRDIKSTSSELTGTPDLNKILTIQNQLNSLTGLHNDKAVAERLLPFIQQVTPSDVTISDLAVDFSANTLTITGQAPSLDRVNTYTDTLKFTTYANAQTNNTKAFSDVVLSQFGRTDTGASYVIATNFDPAIFSNDSTATLKVPSQVSTRSVVEQPSDIFKKNTSTTNSGSN